MWVKTKTELINLDHAATVKEHFNAQNKQYEIYTTRVDGSYGARIAGGLDEDTAFLLFEAISDALADSEKLFDVDEALAVLRPRGEAKV